MENIDKDLEKGLTGKEIAEKYKSKKVRLSINVEEGMDDYLNRLSKDLGVSKSKIIITILDKGLSEIYADLGYGHPENNAVLMSLEYLRSIGEKV